MIQNYLLWPETTIIWKLSLMIKINDSLFSRWAEIVSNWATTKDTGHITQHSEAPDGVDSRYIVLLDFIVFWVFNVNWNTHSFIKMNINSSLSDVLSMHNNACCHWWIILLRWNKLIMINSNNQLNVYPVAVKWRKFLAYIVHR